jgi:SRSO17 transposase
MVEVARTWAQALETLHQRIGRHFRRVEPRRRALHYLHGLLSPCARKNGWQIAEIMGEATPDGMQRLLNAAHWDAHAVRDDLRAYVVEHLGASDAVLIIDETGFLKQGTKSVGVQPQYSGTAGQVDNCQIGVFLCYASARGSAFIDRALYLLRTWTRNQARRTEEHVPSDVPFATKPALAITMLERAIAAEVPFGWVTGDSVYGHDRRLRHCLEQQQQPYVLAVQSTTRLKQDAHWCRSAKQLAAEFAPTDWQRQSAGAGTKGPRWYDWAYQEVWWHSTYAPATAWGQWLLVRRNVQDPADVRYFLVFARRADMTVATVCRVVGMRWQIESGFEAAKGECGLDEYEVRTWDAWHRHITLALLAHAFLNVMRSHIVEPTDEAGADLLPMMVPELRRLVWRLVWARLATHEAVLAWSRWRRRHQRRAQRCQYQRNGTEESSP